MKKQVTLLLLVFLLGLAFQVQARNEALFPKPQAIAHDVAFWKRVYTEVTTSEGFVHDDKDLAVVYEKVKLPEKASRKVRHNHVKRIKKKYKNILSSLARGKRTGLSRDEQRVLDMFPKGVSNKTLRAATKRIRFQLGQANKFRAGLIRSGKWKPFILDNLRKMGLPEEIASLPHVESSFNHRAYSKVGAAGIWQFTRSTGRRFMRIDHIVDERMDPFKASVAAARLLENNYAVTGAWPLAITAYNHGAAGMRRAIQKLGTSDITTVLRRYKSRTFGFASRNFYVAFLAAIEIDSDPEKYFGQLNYEPPADYEFYKLPGYMTANDVMQALNMTRAQFIETNPELRPNVMNGNKYLPKGYEVRIDKSYYRSPEEVNTYIAKLASVKTYAKQKPDLYHRVRRGQTLSTIAARYGVRVSDIVAANGLRSRHRIRVGQVLRLPQRGGSKRAPKPVVVAKEERSPEVEPTAIPASGTYRVRRGDTIERIARRYGTTVRELQAINNLRNKNRIYPGQRLVLAKANGDTYTVRRGDSIDNIAKRFGVPTSEIVALNNLRNKHRIYPGQRLILAKAESTKLELPKTVEPFPVESDVADIADAKPADNATDTSAQVASEASADDATEDTKQATTEETVVADASQDNDESAANSAEANEDPDLEVLGLAVDTPESSDKSPEMLAKIDSDVATDVNDDEPVNSAGNSDADVSIGVSAIKEAEGDAEILADPIDYSVAKNKTIVVQAAETLGHYAEWLGIRASKLRRINKMRYGKPVVIGRKIKLDFRKITPEEFEEQRVAYHRALQEEFFEQFQISGSEKHKVRRGESVWKLAKRKYKIPIWLLRQYNPDIDLSKVQSGTVITFPKVVNRLTEEEKAALKRERQKQARAKIASDT